MRSTLLPYLTIPVVAFALASLVACGGDDSTDGPAASGGTGGTGGTAQGGKAGSENGGSAGSDSGKAGSDSGGGGGDSGGGSLPSCRSGFVTFAGALDGAPAPEPVAYSSKSLSQLGSPSFIVEFLPSGSLYSRFDDPVLDGGTTAIFGILQLPTDDTERPLGLDSTLTISTSGDSYILHLVLEGGELDVCVQ